jgi:hypothetical protein
MITTLPIGRPYTMVQSQAYAMPGRALTVYVPGTDSLEESNDNSNWEAVTLDSNGQATLAAAFVRSTTGTPIVMLKTP